jgi:hypothetical protein
MRKLIVSNLISLDGYASGPGGDVMALPFDATFSDYNLELMQAADTLVSGATTYRGFLSYWPPIADDSAQPESRAATASSSTWWSPTASPPRSRPLAGQDQTRHSKRGIDRGHRGSQSCAGTRHFGFRQHEYLE